MKKTTLRPLFKTSLYITVGLLLAGCSSIKLLEDDGRKLDDKMLVEARTYRSAATVLRPAVVKSAALADPGCSTQFELPFEVYSSYFFKDEDMKIAMLREAGVNEMLTVLAADSSSGLKTGELISAVNGFDSSNTLKMMTELTAARDSGRPFKLKLASGRELSVAPLKVCRGHTVVATPGNAAQQGYHWTLSVHPQEVFRNGLTADEAMWVVLWTQGLSEEGGARMKTFTYVVGGVKVVAFVGLTVATMGAAAAAGTGAAAAGATAGAVAGQMAGTVAVGLVARGVTMAAANKASLSGINSIAAGVFDKADAWTFANMQKLGMDPRAGLSLNDKLVQQGAGSNAFVLDEERLAKMQELIAHLPKKPEPGTVAAAAGLADATDVETPPGADTTAVHEVDIRADSDQ